MTARRQGKRIAALCQGSSQTNGPHTKLATKRKLEGSPEPACKRTRGKSPSESKGRRRTARKPRRRARKTPRPPEDHRQAVSTNAPSEKPDTFTAITAASTGKDTFHAKYEQQVLLGEGGYGSVFAGFRKEDNLPVAIKHISAHTVKHALVFLGGKLTTIPLEVLLMTKANPAANTTGAVGLLDWYELDDELILVMERPVFCMDLRDFIDRAEPVMPENAAKSLIKQLVKAVFSLQRRGVFHRVIKPGNILLDFKNEVPQVRIIDFGCGTILSEGTYTTSPGTPVYSPPEWFKDGRYRADPTDVWQIGVVVYRMLHRAHPFSRKTHIISREPLIKARLSSNCRDFIQSCLNKNPEERPLLQALQSHPWLN